MKKILFLALFPLAVAAQSGTHLSMKMTSERGMDGSVDIFADKPGRRMEFSMGNTARPDAKRFKSISMIIASNPDSIIRLNENNKSFSVMAFSRISVMDHQKYTVKVLGEEKVNGYSCKHVQLTGSTDTYELWNTKEIDYDKFGTMLSIDPRWTSPARYNALKEAHAEGFPVKMIQSNEHMGKTTMEITLLEKKSIDKSLFEIPEGYTNLQRQNPGLGMPNMTPAQRDSAVKQMMQNRQHDTGEGEKKQ